MGSGEVPPTYLWHRHETAKNRGLTQRFESLLRCDLQVLPAVLRKVHEPWRLESLREQVPGPEEVLVRTKACSIWGTDLHIMDGWCYKNRLSDSGMLTSEGRGRK